MIIPPSKASASLALAMGLHAISSLAESGEPAYTDPAPPEVRAVPTDGTAAEPADFDRLTFHAPPKPLHPEAVTSPWPRFLGPEDDGTTPETRLLAELPEGGPAVVWELEKGTGYTSPVMAEGRLVLFDRIGDEERVDCLDPETGWRYWEQAYPVEYRDRYGFSDGPRASAVIDSGKVVTLGVTSTLSCFDLASGTLLWQRALKEEFGVPDYFFGHGACPLVHEGKVIVNLGGRDDLCVAAFDLEKGGLVWGTRHRWKASYASPVVKTLRGAPRLLVFAGGESDPPVGGLLCIDPETGELFDDFPWRADKYESVNGQTPLQIGENRIFISDAYEIGGVALDLTPELEWEVAWKAPDFGMHWSLPLLVDGHVYGFRGRNEPDAWLACHDAATGEEKWRRETEWSLALPDGRDYRMSYLRGSLLRADGRTYALGELGSLGIVELSPEGPEFLQQEQLFLARSTWSPPALHRGLLYISQHEEDMASGKGPRLICYDLRAGELGKQRRGENAE